MLVQLAMLALSVLAIAGAFAAIRSEKSEQVSDLDEEATRESERRWTRVVTGRGRRP